MDVHDNDHDELARRFEEHRPRLLAVARRLLGSPDEADDAIQEAWLRLDRSGAEGIENLEAWLVRTVSRVALNLLRSRSTRAETRLEAALSEEVAEDPAAADPAGEAVLADSLGLALQLVLDTLTPAERLAYVLHDLFAVPFEEIAEVLDRTPDASRCSSVAPVRTATTATRQSSIFRTVPPRARTARNAVAASR